MDFLVVSLQPPYSTMCAGVIVVYYLNQGHTAMCNYISDHATAHGTSVAQSVRFSASLLYISQMAYIKWKKEGKLLTPCRVVGLALEILFKYESESGIVEAGQCGRAEFWGTQEVDGDGNWSGAKTCFVPVLAAHQVLALYILQRMYHWISGLGLSVVDAIVPKSRREGTGHHDLKLKHAVPQKPFYCQGFLSMEVKVSQVGPIGRGFEKAWDSLKKDSMAAMARVLQVPGSVYGAAILFLVGVCDSVELLAKEPPLLVKAQLLVLDATGKPKWSTVLLEKGTVPVEPKPPPPKRQRQGASWDEVRACLHGKTMDFEGVVYVRILDVFKAISTNKTSKSPGQKIATYQKVLNFAEGTHYIRKRYPAKQRGSEAYWLTWPAAASKVYQYETVG
jgi:hypothetical protein